MVGWVEEGWGSCGCGSEQDGGEKNGKGKVEKEDGNKHRSGDRCGFKEGLREGKLNIANTVRGVCD